MSAGRTRLKVQARQVTFRRPGGIGGMTQLVKHLPFEYQDLSVVSRTCQNKNKNQTGKAWGPAPPIPELEKQ